MRSLSTRLLHFALILSLLALASNSVIAQNNKRPNILLLFSDDQRPDTIHALGNPVIQTPNLDGLVKSGTTFTHTFTTIPVCTPARAELLTGRSAHRNGVRYFQENIRPELTLLPQALTQAGYLTWFTGKWHNDSTPDKRGYQITRRVFRSGMGSHQMTFEENGQKIAGFSSEIFADAAIEFLKSKQTDKPWFAHVSFTAPHDPRTPPEKYKALYDPAKLPLPPNFMPEHPFDNGEMTIRDEQLEKWPRTPDAIRQHLSEYYGMITHMDAQIGRILAALKESGQAENTIIIFASDNGLAIGSHGLMGKMSMYDHSVRVPLIIAGPNVPKDKRIDALSYLYDLYPTLCEMAGIERPASVEGISLVPVLAGKQKDVRESVFCSYLDVQRMVRTKRWKLIEYPKINKTQLFDLENDPYELKDLLAPWRWEKTKWYTPPANGEDIKRTGEEMRAKLSEWEKRLSS